MSTLHPFAFAAIVTMLTTSTTIVAAANCSHCNDTGQCNPVESVTVTELRTVYETHYREEQQVRVKQVAKTIQVPKQVPYKYKTWVRVKKEDVQELEIKTPKFRWVEQKYTVNVPGIDTVTTDGHDTCEIPITVPIEKTRKVKEYFTKTEKKTIKHPYTTLEHREKTKTVTAFIPETVYEDQLETFTVQVPYTVERQVLVPVARRVQNTRPCSCQNHDR